MSSVSRNLETLTTKQLVDLERQIAGEVAKRFQALETAKTDLQTQLGAKLGRILKEMGLPTTAASVNIEVSATNGNGAHKVAKAKPRKRSKIAIKYRNPSNPAETWSGRGRPARWLAALEKQGNKRDQYAVR